jgi:RNA polymerase sigma factor (sigma-70 family)
MQHMPDSSIAESARFADFYQRYASSILAYVRGYNIQPEDAEDLLIDVFMVALQNPEIWEVSQSRTLAWLKRVAHNKMVDYFRKKTHRHFTNLEQMVEQLYEDNEEEPEYIIVQHENYAQLHAHLATLSLEQQHILRLRFALGLRTREIAAQLKISDAAVRMQISRALKLLRNAYEWKGGKKDGK